MSKAKARAKPSTPKELSERERECRLYMEYRKEYHDLPDLPAVDADQDEIDDAVGAIEDAVQEARNLVADGEEWLKAFQALIEAQAKSKKVPA
jgi:hypothetical protein